MFLYATAEWSAAGNPRVAVELSHNCTYVCQQCRNVSCSEGSGGPSGAAAAAAAPAAGSILSAAGRGRGRGAGGGGAGRGRGRGPLGPAAPPLVLDERLRAVHPGAAPQRTLEFSKVGPPLLSEGCAGGGVACRQRCLPSGCEPEAMAAL